MLAALGISVPWLSYVLLGFGLLEVWALRSRPALAFAVAVGTMIFGSPVVNGNTYALLLAALVPFAWPLEASLQSVARGLGLRPDAPTTSNL